MLDFIEMGRRRKKKDLKIVLYFKLKLIAFDDAYQRHSVST